MTGAAAGSADVIATLPRVRIVWKPPAAFPPLNPIAYYAGRGGDGAHPEDPAIWLSPDHPELVSPRLARLTDEIPLFTELLLASVDVRARDAAADLNELLEQMLRTTSLAERVVVFASIALVLPLFAELFFRGAIFRGLRRGRSDIEGCKRRGERRRRRLGRRRRRRLGRDRRRRLGHDRR